MFKSRTQYVQLSGRGEYAQPTHTDINYTRRTPYQPLEPATRKLTKHYFTLIQATHHKYTTDQAIATHIFPPGMLRQVIRLSAFIRPSTPTEYTHTQIHANTINWMHTNMIILQQHYKNTLHTPTPSPFNLLAFQIATGWARKRYGPRLTQETVTTVQNSLNSSPSHLPTPSPYPKTPHPIPYPDPKSFCPTQGSYSNLVFNPKPLQASQQSLREPPLPPYPKPKGHRSPQQSLWSPPLLPGPKLKDPSLLTPIQESPPL